VGAIVGGGGVSGTAVTTGVGLAVGLSVGAGRDVVMHADRVIPSAKTPMRALRQITCLG
jgi:hypothetical protein